MTVWSSGCGVELSVEGLALERPQARRPRQSREAAGHGGARLAMTGHRQGTYDASEYVFAVDGAREPSPREFPGHGEGDGDGDGDGDVDGRVWSWSSSAVSAPRNERAVERSLTRPGARGTRDLPPPGVERGGRIDDDTGWGSAAVAVAVAALASSLFRTDGEADGGGDDAGDDEGAQDGMG